MAKRRMPRTAPAVALDHGPAIRLARGDVELVDGEEPDNPNRLVRRARTVPAYEAVCETKLQSLVCKTLAETDEAATGAQWRPDGMVVHLAAWQKGHPAEAQLAAREKIRRAKEALEGPHWDMLDDVVLRNRTISSLISGARGRDTLAKRFRTAADRLAVHWRLAPPKST